MPSDVGEFRGHISADSTRISGGWIQPWSVVRGSSYATPVTLTESTKGYWQGRVTPLDERIALFISIEAAEDGSAMAVIREPFHNFKAHRSYRVERNDNSVVFSNLKDPKDQFQGTYDQGPERLTIRFPHFPIEFQLQKRKESDANGFVPRTGGESGYIYEKPIPEDDGWQTSSARMRGSI